MDNFYSNKIVYDFLLGSTLNLPQNYSISFQRPVTYFMQSLVLLHYDVMFYIAAVFPFILFIFLELKIFWRDSNNNLKVTSTEIHIQFIKNILIKINNVFISFFYILLFIVYTIIYNFKNIWVFNSHFSINKKNKSLNYKKIFSLNYSIRYNLQSILNNYVYNLQEITETLYLNRNKIFNVNYDNNFNQFFVFKWNYNFFFKHNIFFTSENFINNNKQFLNYFNNLVYLFYSLTQNLLIYFKNNNLLSVRYIPKSKKYNKIVVGKLQLLIIKIKNIFWIKIGYNIFNKLLNKNILENILWFFDDFFLNTLDSMFFGVNIRGYFSIFGNNFINFFFKSIKSYPTDYYEKIYYVDYEKFYNFSFKYNWPKYLNIFSWFIYEQRLIFYNVYNLFWNSICALECEILFYLENFFKGILKIYILLKKKIWVFYYNYLIFCYCVIYSEDLLLRVNFPKIYNVINSYFINFLDAKITFFFKQKLNLVLHNDFFLNLTSDDLKQMLYEIVNLQKEYKDCLAVYNQMLQEFNKKKLGFLTKDYVYFNNKVINHHQWTHLYNDTNKMVSYLNKNYFILEIIWTILPTISIILILIPSMNLLYSLEFVKIDPLINLKIIGNQWYWSYEYSSNLYNYENLNYKDNLFKDLEFNSFMLDPEILYSYIPEENAFVRNIKNLSVDRNVVLPVKTHIQLLITSNDVLHSWAIPSFGIKMDACPGRLAQVQLFIKHYGIYYGQCSELCGINHGFMPIVVQACDMDFFFYSFVFRNNPYTEFLFSNESLEKEK